MRSRHACIVGLLILLLAQVGRAAATTPGDCGTLLDPAGAARHLELLRAGAYRPAPAREGPWTVRTAVHIVRTDEGQGGMGLEQLGTALEKLNADFAAARIAFAVVDPIDYIDSDFFYYEIETTAAINQLRQTNPIAGAINLYFTENMPFCGLSSFSWQPVQGVVLVNDCVVTYWNPSTFTHEVGHYFDLLHTHETAYGAECVDGSNCGASGDLLCDTPADPNLASCGDGNDYCVNSWCDYTGAFLDPCGGLPYAPDTDNMMSYSRPLCRTAFTVEQLARAEATLVNLRPDHILDMTSVTEAAATPARRLAAPTPNPTGDRVACAVRLERAASVRVEVVDLTGRRVASLLDRDLPAGSHAFAWEPGSRIASGVYFLVLRAEGRSESRRLTLIR